MTQKADTKFKREAERGSHEFQLACEILDATSLLALPIETYSSKCRTGPPADTKSDLDAKVWAGVVPLELTPGEPVDAPDILPGLSGLITCSSNY